MVASELIGKSAGTWHVLHTATATPHTSGRLLRGIVAGNVICCNFFFFQVHQFPLLVCSLFLFCKFWRWDWRSPYCHMTNKNGISINTQAKTICLHNAHEHCGWLPSVFLGRYMRWCPPYYTVPLTAVGYKVWSSHYEVENPTGSWSCWVQVERVWRGLVSIFLASPTPVHSTASTKSKGPTSNDRVH